MKQAAPKRILHVASADLWAGAEVQIYYLLRALHRRADVRVHAFLLNEGELAVRLRSEDIPVTVVHERDHSSWQICRAIHALIVRESIDVVHTHRAKENLLGALAAFRSRRALSLRTVHGRPEHRSSSSLRHIALRIMDVIATFLQRRIVAVSIELGTELARHYPASKLACVTNGIDGTAVIEAAAASSPYSAQPKFNIAFVGRLVAVKRIDIFLEAAAKLVAAQPSRFRFVALGDGPLFDDAIAQTKRLGLEGQVDFLGFQPNALPILGQMDCLLLTSDHEGLPMVVLEALALGVPIVAPAVGGLPEVLGSLSGCRLVAGHRPQDFARSIEELLQDAAPQAEGHQKQRRQSMLPARYEIDSTATNYEAIYRTL